VGSGGTILGGCMLVSKIVNAERTGTDFLKAWQIDFALILDCIWTARMMDFQKKKFKFGI
jgi:hypothetical protein